jgi:hypothetical protein
MSNNCKTRLQAEYQIGLEPENPDSLWPSLNIHETQVRYLTGPLRTGFIYTVKVGIKKNNFAREITLLKPN